MNRNWDAAFAACKSYEEAEVSAALQAAIDAAGGLDWVTPGMRVALKLNLVSAMKPEQAATVHPAVVCALVKLLTARGAHVILGDSPGGLYTAAHLQRVYDVTGLRAAEALEEVRDFIDDAIMVGVGTVTILHGKGTGALKEEIRRYLRTVPEVERAADEHADRGGAGITVVTLRMD